MVPQHVCTEALLTAVHRFRSRPGTNVVVRNLPSGYSRTNSNSLLQAANYGWSTEAVQQGAHLRSGFRSYGACAGLLRPITHVALTENSEADSNTGSDNDPPKPNEHGSASYPHFVFITISSHRVLEVTGLSSLNWTNSLASSSTQAPTISAGLRLSARQGRTPNGRSSSVRLRPAVSTDATRSEERAITTSGLESVLDRRRVNQVTKSTHLPLY